MISLNGPIGYRVSSVYVGSTSKRSLPIIPPAPRCSSEALLRTKSLQIEECWISVVFQPHLSSSRCPPHSAPPSSPSRFFSCLVLFAEWKCLFSSSSQGSLWVNSGQSDLSKGAASRQRSGSLNQADSDESARSFHFPFFIQTFTTDGPAFTLKCNTEPCTNSSQILSEKHHFTQSCLVFAENMLLII